MICLLNKKDRLKYQIYFRHYHFCKPSQQTYFLVDQLKNILPIIMQSTEINHLR